MNEEQNAEITVNAEQFIDDLPHLYSTSNYWLVRANSGEFFTDFQMNNYVGIAFNEISLSSITTPDITIEQIKQIVMQKYPQTNPDNTTAPGQTELFEFEDNPIDASTKKNAGSIAGQLSRFVNSIKVDDMVVVPSENGTMFIVGKVTSAPYEISDEDLQTAISDAEDSDYHASNFKKRINISWIGKFNRADADAHLYPMIYSQHTVTMIPNYVPFINRALFDAYVLDDSELHLTYHITQEENVNAKYFGQFIYLYSQLFEQIENMCSNPSSGLKNTDSDDLIIKTNVQSKGPAEIISKKTLVAGVSLIALACVLSGGKFEISALGNSLKFDTPGIVKNVNDLENGEQDRKSKDALSKEQHTEKQEQNIQEAYRLAKKLHVSVSSLGIDLPRQAETAIQKQLDRESKEKPTSKNKSKQADDTSDNQ